MTDTPTHDWLRPRLEALVAAAQTAGIERDIAVAVLTDLITSEGFNESQLSTDPRA